MQRRHTIHRKTRLAVCGRAAVLADTSPLCSVPPLRVLEFGMRYVNTTARAGSARRLFAVCASVFALFVTIQPVLAQDASDEQERLHAQMLREPTNYPLTFAYVKVATDRGDYEAAI